MLGDCFAVAIDHRSTNPVLTPLRVYPATNVALNKLVLYDRIKKTFEKPLFL